MTTTTDLTTATPCPSWCTTDHRDTPPGKGHHGAAGFGVESCGPLGFRLAQLDIPESDPRVIIGGEGLTADQAHDLGLELVRAADRMRRAARA